MKYLLDTHILICARLDQKKLTASHRAILKSATEEKFISAISVWEISLKYSIGKLELGDLTPDKFIAGIHKIGIKVMAPSTEQYSSFYLLPTINKHKDPFDRMIIWHSIKSGLTLISSDKQMSEYKIHGLHLA